MIQASIIDRPMALNSRQDHLPNLGQDDLVRPAAFTDKVQQGLVLRRCSFRRRDRRQRLNALAFHRHQQSGAVVPQRAGGSASGGFEHGADVSVEFGAPLEPEAVGHFSKDNAGPDGLFGAVVGGR